MTDLRGLFSASTKLCANDLTSTPEPAPKAEIVLVLVLELTELVAILGSQHGYDLLEKVIHVDSVNDSD